MDNAPDLDTAETTVEPQPLHGSAKLTGKDFEEVLLHRARQYDEPAGLYCLNRYGVMAARIKGVWTPITSLPDFDMALPDGRQCCFDAKVCSQPSYDLTGNTSKSFKHQYVFLRRKARMSVLSFLLMHFNERRLKTKVEPAGTYLFPVGDVPFWRAYDSGEQKHISRQDAARYGIVVNWTLPTPRCMKLAPDLLAAVKQYRIWLVEQIGKAN